MKGFIGGWKLSTAAALVTAQDLEREAEREKQQAQRTAQARRKQMERAQKEASRAEAQTKALEEEATRLEALLTAASFASPRLPKVKGASRRSVAAVDEYEGDAESKARREALRKLARELEPNRMPQKSRISPR